jgi:hypothetical protein
VTGTPGAIIAAAAAAAAAAHGSLPEGQGLPPSFGSSYVSPTPGAFTSARAEDSSFKDAIDGLLVLHMGNTPTDTDNHPPPPAATAAANVSSATVAAAAAAIATPPAFTSSVSSGSSIEQDDVEEEDDMDNSGLATGAMEDDVDIDDDDDDMDQDTAVDMEL